MDLSYYTMPLSSKYTKAVNTWHTWSSSLLAASRCISQQKIYSNQALERTVSHLWILTSAPCRCAKQCLGSAFIVTCYEHFERTGKDCSEDVLGGLRTH